MCSTITAFVRRGLRPSGALASWLALPSVLYALTAIPELELLGPEDAE